jgi:hypothetical protein
LAVGPSRIRTGDRGFGASKAQQPALFSVGKLGGSVSPVIRRRVLEVRIAIPPPPSLLLQRLSAAQPPPRRRSVSSRTSLQLLAQQVGGTRRRCHEADGKTFRAAVSLAPCGVCDGERKRRDLMGRLLRWDPARSRVRD